MMHSCHFTPTCQTQPITPPELNSKVKPQESFQSLLPVLYDITVKFLNTKYIVYAEVGIKLPEEAAGEFWDLK